MDFPIAIWLVEALPFPRSVGCVDGKDAIAAEITSLAKSPVIDCEAAGNVTARLALFCAAGTEAFPALFADACCGAAAGVLARHMLARKLARRFGIALSPGMQPPVPSGVVHDFVQGLQPLLGLRGVQVVELAGQPATGGHDLRY